jgi:23S rRNA (guanosine2251-2'-O)-methyltransferase
MKQYVFGFHAANSVIKHRPSHVKLMWFDSARQDARIKGLVDFAKKQGVNLREGERRELDRLVPDMVHQGIVLEVSSQALFLELSELLLIDDPQMGVLILDGVTDPHNLGACFRVACAAGIKAIIVPKDRSSPINSVVAKTASGALEHVFFVQVPNLARALDTLKEANFFVLGADERGERHIFDVDMTGKIAFVLGREGEGLRELTKKKCDELVKIPMLGEVESLNVSVCAGVCLFERVRQLSLSVKLL